MKLMILAMITLFASGAWADENLAARIRFVETITAPTAHVQEMAAVDTPIFLGNTVDTENARMEVVALGGQEFWFDRGSRFHFESVDSEGAGTTLFLGKGAFVVKTGAPMSVIAGAASVYLPEQGSYQLRKPEIGDSKTFIQVIEGAEPEVMDRGGFLSRIRASDEADAALQEWASRRESDWNRTLMRAGVFSNVASQPPYAAHTGTEGKTQWLRVDGVRPLHELTSWVGVDDRYIPHWYVMSNLGLDGIPFRLMTSVDWLLFLGRYRYHTVKWVWSVDQGWHAALVYDPMAGFGAQYGGSYWNPGFAWIPLRYASIFPWYRYMVDGDLARAYHASHDKIRTVRHLTGVQQTRLRTDPGLRGQSRALNVTVKPREIRVAQLQSRLAEARASDRWLRGVSSVAARSVMRAPARVAKPGPRITSSVPMRAAPVSGRAVNVKVK